MLLAPGTAALVACGGPLSATAQATVMGSDSVELRLAVEPARGDPAGPLNLSLSVTNRGNAPVTLEFATSQRYDFAIVRAGGTVVWRWSADMMFAQVLGYERLGEGETITFLESAPAVPPGGYRVTGRLTAASHPLETSVVIEVP